MAQSNIESAQLEITVSQVPPLNEKHFQEDAGSIENLKDHNPQNFPNEIPINENNVEIEEFIQLEETFKTVILLSFMTQSINILMLIKKTT